MKFIGKDFGRSYIEIAEDLRLAALRVAGEGYSTGLATIGQQMPALLMPTCRLLPRLLQCCKMFQTFSFGIVQWATEVMTPASMYFLWEKGS